MMPCISPKPSIDDTIAVSAITQFVESIMTTLPMNIVTAETRLVRLFCSVCPMVSTSLVTRESTSPVEVDWK